MITPKELKKLFEDEIYTLSFIEVHILAEAFLRRIVYLGCRRCGFDDKGAQHIATYQFIRDKKLYTTLFEMLSDDRSLAQKLRAKHCDFDRLIKLFEDYSSTYRNRIVHGAATVSPGKFHDLLRHIDVSFVREFNRVLKSHFGHSALDTPASWEFSSGHARRSFEKVRDDMRALAESKKWNDTFGGEKLLREDLGQEQVLKELKATAYGLH